MTVWIGQVKEPCISSLIISYLPSQVNSLCRLMSVSSSFNQWQSQSLHRERSSCRRFAKNIIFSPSEAFYGLWPKYASNLVGKYHSILDSYRYQSFNGAGTSLAAREQILNHNFFLSEVRHCRSNNIHFLPYQAVLFAKVWFEWTKTHIRLDTNDFLEWTSKTVIWKENHFPKEINFCSSLGRVEAKQKEISKKYQNSFKQYK